MKDTITVQFTELEARALSHAAGQMRDDYSEQLNGNTDVGVTNGEARACLRALEKLDSERAKLRRKMEGCRRQIQAELEKNPTPSQGKEG